jgi:hypothetical protein
MSVFNCEFCGIPYKHQKRLITHQANTTKCIKLQIKKLGKPLSEINKEKNDKVGAPAKVEAPKPVVKDESSSDEDEINFTEEVSSDEVDENEELPFSSSSESSSSESETDEVYKRVDPGKFNNLFKKKQTTIKTEIIRDDQPPEVHKRKIEEFLPPKSEKIVSSEQVLPVIPAVVQPVIDIKGLSEDINKNIEKKITSSITSLENKVNSLLDVIGKVNNSISALEKRMKSMEPPKEVEKDIERIMDDKLHEMFYITKKMLAEVESKNDLLDIFRENMEDIVENHYDLYKKFKYIKDDMEDMVYDKGSQKSGRRR